MTTTLTSAPIEVISLTPEEVADRYAGIDVLSIGILFDAEGHGRPAGEHRR